MEHVSLRWGVYAQEYTVWLSEGSLLWLHPKYTVGLLVAKGLLLPASLVAVAQCEVLIHFVSSYVYC